MARRLSKPLDKDTKEQLTRQAKQRRLAHPLLKDLTALDLQVACDAAEESGIVLATDVLKVKHCRLKYVSHEQAAALSVRLPHTSKRISVYMGGSSAEVVTVPVWQHSAILFALNWLGVEEAGRKYIRYWSPRNRK
jgi:hypothetical protein